MPRGLTALWPAGRLHHRPPALHHRKRQKRDLKRLALRLPDPLVARSQFNADQRSKTPPVLRRKQHANTRRTLGVYGPSTSQSGARPTPPSRRQTGSTLRIPLSARLVTAAMIEQRCRRDYDDWADLLTQNTASGPVQNQLHARRPPAKKPSTAYHRPHDQSVAVRHDCDPDAAAPLITARHLDSPRSVSPESARLAGDEHNILTYQGALGGNRRLNAAGPERIPAGRHACAGHRRFSPQLAQTLPLCSTAITGVDGVHRGSQTSSRTRQQHNLFGASCKPQSGQRGLVNAQVAGTTLPGHRPRDGGRTSRTLCRLGHKQAKTAAATYRQQPATHPQADTWPDLDPAAP